MTYTSWRGNVGVIKPTRSSTSFQDLVGILPEGIGVIPIYLDLRYKSADEFKEAMPSYAAKVAELAEQAVDLIHPEGAPPFMIEGFKGEQRRIRGWERQYGIPIFTSGMCQVAALKALGIKKFVGLSSLSGSLAKSFAQYFTDAGFKVLAMGNPEPDIDAGTLSAEQIYTMTKKAFLAQKGGPEAVYCLGSTWRVFDMIEALEQDLGVPVLSPVAVRSWYIQRQLHVRQPLAGRGRLLAEMP